MSPLPKWPCPLWTPEEAELISLAASLAPKRSFDSAGVKISLTLRPFETEPGPAPAVLIRLSCGPCPAVIGLSDWHLLAIHPAAAGLDPELLPLELRLALLESLLRPVFDELARLLGDDLLIGPAPTDSWPESGRKLRYSLELEAQGARAAQILSLAFPSKEKLNGLRTMLSARSRPKAIDFGALALPMAITIGGMRLSVNELLSLSPGDLLIADDPPISPKSARFEYPGLPSASLELSPGRAVAATALSIKETSVAEETKAAPGPQPPSPGGAGPLPKDLELPLRFEVGRRLATLQELEAFAPGQVLAFDSDPNQPVTVTCHGQAVAKGALVDLGSGRLGVQLTLVGLSSLAAAAPGPGDAPKGPGEADHG
jgi:type III secretion system YscQ/HrcQ family protein